MFFFFPMTLDRTQRISSTIVVVALAVMPVMLVVGRTPPLWAVVVMGVTLATMGIAAALAPAGVEIEGRELRILRRGAPPVRVSVDDVTSVVDARERYSWWRFGLRLFGSCGFLGCFGLFWTSDLGSHWTYATRSGQAITVRRRRGLPLVLVVDDPSAFREALQNWWRTRSAL